MTHPKSKKGRILINIIMILSPTSSRSNCTADQLTYPSRSTHCLSFEGKKHGFYTEWGFVLK